MSNKVGWDYQTSNNDKYFISILCNIVLQVVDLGSSIKDEEAFDDDNYLGL